jgi:cytochrome b561
MQPIDTVHARYDSGTMILHWLTAVLVLGQWLGAQTIDWFPKGALRVDARSLHMTGGILLGIIIVCRILWRVTKGRQLPGVGSPPVRIVAKATHWGLYALVIFMILVGIALAWTRGENLFNLVTIPAFDPGNRALPDRIQGIHATVGWLILGLAGLHAGAALFHRYVWHDGVLGRMWPWARSA